jgi:catechol 2,3-dioxygenase-like lactoylglutathione lyase family enzyme
VTSLRYPHSAAAGATDMPQLATAQPARHPSPIAKARALAHLVFERPNVDEATRFLTDFGLRIAARTDDSVFLRAAAGGAPFCYVVRRAPKPRFVGLALEVRSQVDLQALARLPGASPIAPLMTPGGGEAVRLVDPSGFQVQAVHGHVPADPLPHRAPLSINSSHEQPRINVAQRPPVQPPEVLKLGHVVLEVADFQATSAWYAQCFGFIPSDVQVLPGGIPAVTFMRLDLGDTPADHHTLALAQGFMPAYSHSAFEVVDADAVAVGQRVLRERGWTHAWGIGRHILGSQIFDYWCDPFDAKHEHYCDGDLFTAAAPMGVHPLARDAMAQWGPQMPASFTKPRLTPSNIAALLRSLRLSPDVTLRKLRKLAKAFA